MFTVGVEEEFLLFDPGGQVAPVAAEVVRRGEGRVEPRFMAYQVGTSTRPCARLAELRAALVRQRTLARYLRPDMRYRGSPERREPSIA